VLLVSQESHLHLALLWGSPPSPHPRGAHPNNPPRYRAPSASGPVSDRMMTEGVQNAGPWMGPAIPSSQRVITGVSTQRLVNAYSFPLIGSMGREGGSGTRVTPGSPSVIGPSGREGRGRTASHPSPVTSLEWLRGWGQGQLGLVPHHLYGLHPLRGWALVHGRRQVNACLPPGIPSLPF